MMLSSISHEFRTPINAFKSALMLLDISAYEMEKHMIRLEQVDNEVKSEMEATLVTNKRYVDICKISSSILENHTENIIDVVKFESGSFDIEVSEFSIGTLVDEIKYMFDMQ